MIQLNKGQFLVIGHIKIRFKKIPEKEMKKSNNKELMNKTNYLFYD
jgi:hypothetical protein